MLKKWMTLMLVLMMTVWACSDSAEKKETAEATQKAPVEKTKKISLKTQEGMMMKLKEFGITIPEPLAFVDIERKSSEYRAKFEAKDIDESVRAELDKWYAGLVSKFTEEGWSQTVVQDNEEMFGAVYNSCIFLKRQGGESTLTDGVSLTTIYDAGKKSYTVYVRPAEH